MRTEQTTVLERETGESSTAQGESVRMPTADDAPRTDSPAQTPLPSTSRFEPLAATDFMALPETPLIGQRRGGFLRDAVLYPQVYIWYVLFASLDIMVTWVVLHFGGAEVNPAGQWVIERYNLAGLVVYKFVLVMFVIAICEIVGRRRERVGHRLAEWAVAITAIPVVIGLTQLLRTTLNHAPVDPAL